MRQLLTSLDGPNMHGHTVTVDDKGNGATAPDSTGHAHVVIMGEVMPAGNPEHEHELLGHTTVDLSEKLK